MSRLLRQLLRDEMASSTVEYALLLALIAVVAMAAFTALGGQMKIVLAQSTSHLSTEPKS